MSHDSCLTLLLLILLHSLTYRVGVGGACGGLWVWESSVVGVGLLLILLHSLTHLVGVGGACGGLLLLRHEELLLLILLHSLTYLNIVMTRTPAVKRSSFCVAYIYEIMF